jgi:hypothetical protein
MARPGPVARVRAARNAGGLPRPLPADAAAGDPGAVARRGGEGRGAVLHVQPHGYS